MTRTSTVSIDRAYLVNLNTSRVLIGLMVFIALFSLLTNPDFYDSSPDILRIITLANVAFGSLIILLSFTSESVKNQFFFFTILYLLLPFMGFALSLHYTNFTETVSYLMIGYALVVPWYFMRQAHLVLFQIFMVLGVVLTVLLTPESQPDSNLFMYSFIGVNVFTFILANAKISSTRSLMEKSQEAVNFEEYLQEGLIQLDSNYNIIHINPYLGQKLGREVSQFLGRFAVTEVIPKEYQSHLIKRMMSDEIGQEPSTEFIELLHSDGSLVPFQVSYSPRKKENGDTVGYNILFIDASHSQERIRIVEEKFHSLEKQLRDTNAKKLELERFASTIANDLRSPLEIINRGVQILYSMSGSDDPVFQQYMEEIENNVGRVYEIMQAVLLYSVTDVTQMTPRSLDLNQVLTEVTGSLSPLLEANEVNIHFEDMPLVHADKVQILRLFRNFIESSITRRGEEKPEIFLTYTRDKDKGMYIFSIQDNGIGISREDYDNIFRIFQEEEVPDVNANSVGFGLSICNKIINNHGGKLWFTSNSGRGTTFHFSIPIPQEESELVH